MKKVSLYIATSLDGFIADEAGGVAWLEGDGSEPENQGSYPSFYESVDTIVLGYRTYEQIITELSPEAWPYEGKSCYVLSRQEREGDPRVQFSQLSPCELLAELKAAAQPSQHIWICGGAQIAQPLLAAGAVDELRIALIPTLLGKGVRLWGQMPQAQKLQLTASYKYNGIVEVCYRTQ